jgi:hypothetical protein
MTAIPPLAPATPWLTSLSTKERNELQRAMGDANLDGLVSATELKKALNDSDTTAIDSYVNNGMREALADLAILQEAAKITAANHKLSSLHSEFIKQAAEQRQYIDERTTIDTVKYAAASEESINIDAMRHALSHYGDEYNKARYIVNTKDRIKQFEAIEEQVSIESKCLEETFKGIATIPRGIEIPTDITGTLQLDPSAIHEAAKDLMYSAFRAQPSQQKPASLTRAELMKRA